jgi:hypothetical protein
MLKLVSALKVLTATLLLVQPALAAMADEDYVNHAFGTVAVLHASRQVVDPNQGWWGDKAAKEFQNPAYLVGIINSRRMDRQIQPLLDPNDTSAVMLGIKETGPSGFRYTIEFSGMRPSEVQALFDVLGGAGKVLPGATSVTFEPLQRRSIYGSATAGAPIMLSIGNTRIEATAGSNFDELRGRVASALQGIFGKPVPFDFTFSRSIFMDGTDTADISVYVDLNPPAPIDSELNAEYDH